MSICFFVLYFYYVVDIRLCQRCFFLLYFKKIYGRLLLEIIGYVNPYQCVNLYNISCILCSRWYGSTLFYCTAQQKRGGNFTTAPLFIPSEHLLLPDRFVLQRIKNRLGWSSKFYNPQLAFPIWQISHVRIGVILGIMSNIYPASPAANPR